jgi:hypothetical protein
MTGVFGRSFLWREGGEKEGTKKVYPYVYK